MHVVSVDPADADQAVPVDTAVTISFNVKMDPLTLTAQMTAGQCAGNIQISCDNFATCVATDTPSIDASGAVLTIQPTIDLPTSSTCKVKVKTGAKDTSGNPLTSESDMATGFTTAAPAAGCSTGPAIVIAQIYPGGGNSSAVYKTKFVELFNRSGASVNVTGWSLQYESQNGSTWTPTALSGTIPAGGHYLVALFTNTTPPIVGAALPVNADSTDITNPSGTSGHLALVSNTTALGTQCPTISTTVIDFVAYGKPNACAKFTVNTSGTASGADNTMSLQRKGGGCTVSATDDPSTDFTAAAVVAPHDLASTASPLCSVCQ